jgi:hypothetical protein
MPSGLADGQVPIRPLSDLDKYLKYLALIRIVSSERPATKQFTL